jgi:phage terminase Nu1 subunit (DNA packaging protein)
MLDDRVTQAAFGELVGISQQAVSELMAKKVLLPGMTARVWLLAYCANLRDVAAGRDPEGALVVERARLAREQADGFALKNAIARREFAPVGLLSDVLAAAAAGVVDRFDALPATLRKACPDLPQEARDAIARTIAEARNEWIRATASLSVRRLDELTEPDEADADAPGEPPGLEFAVPT